MRNNDEDDDMDEQMNNTTGNKDWGDLINEIEEDLEVRGVERFLQETDAILNDHIYNLIRLQRLLNSQEDSSLEASDPSLSLSNVNRLMGEVTKERKRWRKVSKFLNVPLDDEDDDVDQEEDKLVLDPRATAQVVAPVMEYSQELFPKWNHLGEGCYGTVYKARYAGHIPVVIKVLNRRQSTAERQKMSFLSEVRNMMIVSVITIILGVI
eukprot:TRINITY_DN1387_c5_g1_i3.p1 TRINITY_DN1387_c5_g1~~TRINITY_DN1387_c5_g1_i3.p1  ORF type:complete len:210 (+),score=47.95 TRINITY_DN1387_c5_g1_i3:94-723(+)